MTGRHIASRSALGYLTLSAFVAVAVLMMAKTGQARSLDEIRASGELRICLAPIHPSIAIAEPAGCGDDCRFSGPAFEAAEAFAATLKDIAEPVYRKIAWDEQFQNAAGETIREKAYTPALLANGTCDIFPNHMTVTDWRLSKIDIVPLFQNRMMVMVNKGRADEFKNASDLAGKITAVEENTSFHSWLQKQNTQDYATDPVVINLEVAAENYELLDDGEIDFAIADANSALWMIRHQLKQTEVAFPVGDSQQIGWALSTEDAELRQLVEAFFYEQKAAQATKLNQIWEKHFGVSLNRFETLVKALR